MNDAYKFSVLISVYKNEKADYFNEALESILKQKLKPSEVVIVKDGPLTIELNDVIEKFISKYNNLFKIVNIEKNVGLGEALKIGLTNCSNELVARMDSDDICLYDRFYLQIEEFKKNENLIMVGGQIAEFKRNSNEIVAKRNVPIKYEEVVQFARRRNPFNHVTVMFKKNKVLDVGNYENVPYFEDYYLWVKMLQAGYEMKNINKDLVYVRVGDGMMKRRGGISYARSHIYFENRIYRLGFISLFTYITNCIIRIGVSIIPEKQRGFLYKIILRN